MANPKRRRSEDDDSPPAKKQKTNTNFTIKEFMADFPRMRGPISMENDSPLPRTVLADNELRNTAKDRKPALRSTFNVTLPLQLGEYENEQAENAPYEWMRKQYSHCIIPELGEEYDFEYDSETFHSLRDLHNARVRIRDGKFLPDYIVCSLATRWICLEEKDRPPSDGYLANGEVFVGDCLPLTDSNDDSNDALEKYFEDKYVGGISAQHYIPRSKYSVHFVGKPNMNESREIQSVNVGSVLIRNTRTGNVVHIDTGLPNSRDTRARQAGKVLKSWLEFQKQKHPDAELGPITSSVPLILEVDRETHPTLRSIHAPVSASLFLRRRITNWGDVNAFNLRNTPSSKNMANYALQNISGWLGLKSNRARQGEGQSKGKTNTRQSFENNYRRGGLMGREQRAPESERILTATQGEAPVYNEEEADSDDEASDHEGSRAGSSHETISGDDDPSIMYQPNDDDDSLDDEAFDDEMAMDDEHVEKVSTKNVSFKAPSNEPEDTEAENLFAENPNAAEPFIVEPAAAVSSQKERSDEMAIDERPRNAEPNKNGAANAGLTAKIWNFDDNGEDDGNGKYRSLFASA
ncbi:hypothetical protein F5883DRAFT_613062 [Diaporthe sp. PMI_573]|nr:hypothetical protein F5883DRAFT_613062 [Diaporthaceae sp. PMI_573]